MAPTAWFYLTFTNYEWLCVHSLETVTSKKHRKLIDSIWNIKTVAALVIIAIMHQWQVYRDWSTSTELNALVAVWIYAMAWFTSFCSCVFNWTWFPWFRLHMTSRLKAVVVSVSCADVRKRNWLKYWLLILWTFPSNWSHSRLTHKTWWCHYDFCFTAI